MALYEHVVVPFDGSAASGRAAALGADLAGEFGARLVTVTSSAVTDKDEMAAMKRRALAMSDGAVDVRIERADNPAEAIRIAMAFRPDGLVCMASHGRRGVERALEGSVSEAVVAAVDGPVVLVGPAYVEVAPKDLEQLVICIDGSETSHVAIPLAAAWARQLDLPCTLVCVATGQPLPDMEHVTALLGLASPHVESVFVTTPSPAAGILEVTNDAGSCIVVMASHGRTGYRRLVGGSVVADVISTSRAPVLVQRAVSMRPGTFIREAASEAGGGIVGP